MTNIKKTAAVSVMVLALAAGTASAKTIDGTNRGETLNGTAKADAISAFGGADLVRGYGGADTLYGGDEAGWGDALYGGTANDRLLGQRGEDALYGARGDDRMNGGYGPDLVVGGYGNDTLGGGPGADKVDAQDGQKDTILVREGEGDVVYYDRGLDEFLISIPSGPTATKGAEATVAEATRAADLSTAKPPQGLFEPTGEILVDHEGEELLVAEGELEGHLGHGDEILDPTGRAKAGQERR